MEKIQKNDCYTCPHRRQVPGSAHSQCNVIKPPSSFEIAMAVACGFLKEISVEVNGEEKAMLKFDPHGVRNGWCIWPENFDPVWVECYLPILKKFHLSYHLKNK